MCQVDNAKAEEHLSFQVILGLVDTAVFTTTGKHLSNIEVLVLQGSWQGQRYPQIAAQSGYALDYLKNDIGPHLWKRLSKALGEKVSKANLTAVLQQRIYQQEQETNRGGVRALVQQDAVAPHLVFAQSNRVARVEATKPNSEEGMAELNDSKIHPTVPRTVTLEQESKKLDENPQTTKSPASVSELTSQNKTLTQRQQLTLTSRQLAVSNSEVAFNTKQQSQKAVKLSQCLYHNLPPRDYTTLVGREPEVKRLLKWLSFEHPTPRIGIEGIGGVGKTALLLDVAHRCWQASQEAEIREVSREALPTFEAIAFTSAKTQHFTDCGIVPRFRQEGTLREILRTIARTLHCPDKPSASFAEAGDQILRCLEHQRVLLIVDNLDELAEQQDILSFLYELPATVKVVITSRECTPFPTIRLNALPPTEALHLIQHQARDKGMQLNLGESQMLYQSTGGIPAAIVYAIGQLTMGYGLQEVPSRLQQPDGDFSRFYFERAIQSLQGTHAHSLLLALALFSKPPVREAICAIAAVTNSSVATEGFVRLQQLSLIQLQRGRYSMPQLTRRFVLAKLAADRECEQSMRDRWVQWYLKLAQEQGGKDWKEWQDYSALEQEWENITDAIEWCIAHERYPEVCQLWRNVKCYTYSQGYRQSRLSCWDTPLDWLSWMIQSAQTRKDWATMAELMGDRAWKLTLLEQPQHLLTASILFTQAWELRQHQPVSWQIELATHIAEWHLQQQQFSLATQWLNQARSLLDGTRLASFDTARQAMLIDYYQGEVYYKTGEYDRSQALFEKLASQAQAIGWQRALFLAKDFLADIAIQQGELDKAQQLLAEGLQVVQAQGDRCSEAYIKRSLAKLE
ncbi:MAG TPA: AAA family ATPase [Coleofasciculaceae cyanobacterium]